MKIGLCPLALLKGSLYVLHKTRGILMKTFLRHAFLPATALLLVGQMGPAYAGQDVFKIYAPGMRATAGAPVVPPTYATLNPNDKGATITLSSDSLSMSGSSADGVRATIGHSSGKWYFEATLTALSIGTWPGSVGLMTATAPLRISASSAGYFQFCPQPGPAVSWTNHSQSYGVAAAVNTVIGVAVDLDNRQVTYYENGVSQGVGIPSSALSAGTYYPYVNSSSLGSASGWSLNFGAKPFAHTVPAGYNAGWY
jgi:hypothetical protein